MKMDFTNAIDAYLKDGKISSWSFEPGEGYSGVKYEGVDGFVLPSEAELTEEAKVLQAEYDAQEYARNRKTSYPPIGDQLDMQYHDQVNGTTKWKDAIAKVKSDNPKG